VAALLCWSDKIEKKLKFEIVTEKINRAYEVYNMKSVKEYRKCLL